MGNTYKKLFVIVTVIIALLNSTPASALYADANRFLFATSLQYGGASSWSEPKRYSEYVSYAEVTGVQINTIPAGKPQGAYVNINGKMNISFLDRTNQYYPYVTDLWDLTVVCGWDGTTMITEGAAVSYDRGNWEGVVNNSMSKVTYLNVNFTWSGRINGDYNAVPAGSVLSCSVRRKTSRGSYYAPFAVGTLNNTYVYSDNSAYNSYLQVDTSNDASLQAIVGVQTAVENLSQQQERLIDIEQQTFDWITNRTPASVDTSQLGNSVGWLPAGPVDSILTLPLSLLRGIVGVFTNTSCTPLVVPVPFVNSNITLPCVSSLMDSIGFTPIWTIVGGAISAVIIWQTLKWLYKFVDDTLTFRENNSGMWGGL